MNLLDNLRRALGLGAGSTGAAIGDPARVEAVERTLADLRPLLALDGGDVTLVEVSSCGRVSIRFSGACRSCHARATTLQEALEPTLRERLAWVSEVRAL